MRRTFILSLTLVIFFITSAICYADYEYGPPSAPSVYVGDGTVIINTPGMVQQPASPAVQERRVMQCAPDTVWSPKNKRCISEDGGGASIFPSASSVSGKFIVNHLSGKCIDVAGAPGQHNGAKLQLWDCELSGRNSDNNSTTDQQWKMTREGFIVNVLSGKCIDVAGAPGRNNGSQLQLWDCERSGRNPDNNSITDQKWSWK